MKSHQPAPTAVAIVLTCYGLAFPPVSHAGGFLDELRDTLKKLTHPSATGTPASNAAAAAPIPVPPDSGTVKGTGAILKATPDIGAGDFRLGMTVNEAIAAMKSLKMLSGPHSPEQGIWTFRISRMPGHELVGGAAGQAGNENGRLNFTMYPNPPVVSAIERSVSYSGEKAPTVRAALETLRKKYGPETLSYPDADVLIWLFDYKGHPLSKAQADRLKKEGCPQTTYDQVIEPIGDEAASPNRITQGIEGIAKPVCYSLISVKAELNGQSAVPGGPATADKGWESISDVPMAGLTVSIYDIPLEYSAAEVSRKIALHNGELKKQKEGDSGK
jgi:hypothetical protein